MSPLPENWLRTVLLFGAAAVVIGGLAVAGGAITITASSGHWAPTEWLLDFTRRRSVAVRSADVEVPRLDRRPLAHVAGHYEMSCRQCHGAPGRGRSATMDGLAAEPPEMTALVSDRDPEDLFYVVRHGVKMTAMPAWPALDREDEIWSMVAFLLRLPELDSVAYAHLAGGRDPDAPDAGEGGPDSGAGAVGPARVPTVVEIRCGRCHRVDGRGRDAAVPRLAGQKEAYLRMSLGAFAAGRRHSGIMQVAVSGLGLGTLDGAARYFAALPAAPAAGREPAEPSPELRRRGERVAHAGIPGEKVPSCAACHGPEGAERRNETYPYLAGQPAGYLANQLDLFRTGRRGEAAYPHVMELSARGLTDEDIAAVAAYYAFLEP